MGIVKEAVVKIDAELLSKVDGILKTKSGKMKYVNKKHFVDLAVMEKLEREK